MSSTIVMTVIGADRPGLVQQLAACVADHGGNWLESRMCQLGGQFAGIVRAEVPAARLPALQQALQQLGPSGLRVTVDTAGATLPAGAGTSAEIEVVGHDRPGILSAVSAVLAEHDINVEDLSSECVSAPMTGEILFQARARVFVPATTKVDSVRSALEMIAAELMVDIRLQPAGD